MLIASIEVILRWSMRPIKTFGKHDEKYFAKGRRFDEFETKP